MEGCLDDDSNLGESETQGQFILPASQEETQDDVANNPEERMKNILTRLPALQGDIGMFDMPSDSCTEEEPSKGKVLVTDTDSVYEGEGVVEQPDYVSETESDRLEETVIQRKLDNTIIHELYQTQKGHARGDHFDLFPSSQTDMFDEHNAGVTSTPSEHIASLQISQKPMLVPETVDDDDNEIPPSPGLYGSTPIIIPSTPTQDAGNLLEDLNEPKDEYVPKSGNIGPKNKSDSNTSDENTYDFMANNTFVSDSQIDRIDKDKTLVKKDQERESNGEHSSHEENQSHSPTSQSFLAALQVPTLVDEHRPVPQHITKSSQLLQHSEPQDQSLEIIGVEEPLERPGLDKTERCVRSNVTSQKLLQDSDVIIIASGSASIHGEENTESDELALRLSPSQNGSTQGPFEHQSSDHPQRSAVTHGHKLTNIESPPLPEKSQNIEVSNTDNKNKDRKNLQIEIDNNKNRALPGNKSHSQGDWDKTSVEVVDEGRRSSSEPRSQGGNKRRSRLEKTLQEINDNPLIKWKDESDIEEFHLDIVRDSHYPASSCEVTMETAADTGQVKSGAVERQSEDKEVSPPVPEPTMDNLSISMIHSESQSVTQPIFRLERPGVCESELTEDTNVDVFPANTMLTHTTHRKHHLNDSDDDIQEDWARPDRATNRQEPVSETAIQDALPSSQYPVSEAGIQDTLPVSADVLVAHRINDSQKEATNTTEETQDYEPTIPDESTNIDLNGNTDKSAAQKSNTNTDHSHISRTNIPDTIGKTTDETRPNVHTADETRSNVHTADETRSNVSTACETRSNVHTAGEMRSDVGNIADSVELIEKSGQVSLAEISTQTEDKAVGNVADFEGVDESVVQKVAEYLQTGYRPRSRASSTCTEHSDNMHGEAGSEKGDSAMKTPRSKIPAGSDRIKTPISFRRQSSQDTKVTKSPQEIQVIVKTYSDLIAKKKLKQKLKEMKQATSTSHNPNPAAGEFDIAGKLLPRRLSTQSLPEELLRSKTNHPVHPSRYVHHTETNHPVHPSRNVHHTEWMSAKRPQTPKTPLIDTIIETAEANVLWNSNKEVSKRFTPGSEGDNVNKEQTVEKYSDNKIASELAQRQKTSQISEETTISKPLLTTNEPTGIENREFVKIAAYRTDISQNIHELKTAQVVLKKLSPPTVSTKKTSSVSYAVRSAQRAKERNKKLLSAQKRNERRKSLETLSPQATSGSFVAGTQTFASTDAIQQAKLLDQGDPYRFVGSQISPDQVIEARIPPLNPGNMENTPQSSRKRQRLQHRKSGLKKSKTDADASNPGKTPHVLFQTVTSPTLSSQSSDVTVTTIGSLPSMPSSISQSSPARDTITSPSNSSGRQTMSEKIATLPDTLPLQHSEEDQELSTVVIEKVERVYTVREITTTKKITGPRGQVIENTQNVRKCEPVLVTENSNRHVEYRYIPSPSRTTSSLTSGDLGDISSSLSRSSKSGISGSSMGSKVSLVSSAASSLDQSAALTHSIRPLSTQTSLDHSDAHTYSIKHLETQRSVDDEQENNEPVISERSRRLSATKDQHITRNESDVEPRAMGAPAIVPRSRTPRTPSTEAVKPTSPHSSRTATPLQHSDQEHSDVTTPLGSTINKTGSYLHSRTVSVESPKVSDSLFTSSSDEKRKPSTSARSSPRKREPGNTSTGVPQDYTSVKDNAPLGSQPLSQQDTMVTTAGNIGSRVIAKWKDDFYYPGTLKSSVDRYFKHQVRFDDGDSLAVKASDILLIGRLPVGQSVMVLTADGDFEFGLILERHDDRYTVETDEGTSGSYSLSQVILSCDQAACIISDHGSEVMLQDNVTSGLASNLGDVCLENLVDTPRRSALKQTTAKRSAAKQKTEEKGTDQGQRKKGRKRKLETMKPQATSTPTPKGKSETMATKKRKVLDESGPSSSPIRGIQDSPSSTVRKSPRKLRVGLFAKGLGPIPTKKIFNGIYFLLTHVEKTSEQKAEERKLLQDSSLDTSTDESATEDDESAPFDKDHLKSQIEAGGGVVLDNMDENLITSGKKKLVLLSSAYQRTIKYLQCLALGVSCLSHVWVLHSCTQGVLLDEKSYTLPAGISLEKRKVMEWRGKNDIFQGVKAVVYSKNSKFVDSWSTIMRLGKCHVYKHLQYTCVDVIVTDNSCTATVERQAKSNSVPLVSTEWVIQSLINNRVVSYSGHPRYRHDLLI